MKTSFGSAVTAGAPCRSEITPRVRSGRAVARIDLHDEKVRPSVVSGFESAISTAPERYKRNRSAIRRDFENTDREPDVGTGRRSNDRYRKTQRQFPC